MRCLWTHGFWPSSTWSPSLLLSLLPCSISLPHIYLSASHLLLKKSLLLTLANGLFCTLIQAEASLTNWMLTALAVIKGWVRLGVHTCFTTQRNHDVFPVLWSHFTRHGLKCPMSFPYILLCFLFPHYMLYIGYQGQNITEGYQSADVCMNVFPGTVNSLSSQGDGEGLSTVGCSWVLNAIWELLSQPTKCIQKLWCEASLKACIVLNSLMQMDQMPWGTSDITQYLCVTYYL